MGTFLVGFGAQEFAKNSMIVNSIIKTWYRFIKAPIIFS
jgi:hypothetical protein|tara:strand:- start:545 stop:661 length:117 start_codon:yes stop_codon:yes gene_type:complete